MSQEKLETMSMQNFWGVKEVHYGIMQVVNGKFCLFKNVNSCSTLIKHRTELRQLVLDGKSLVSKLCLISQFDNPV